MRHDEHLSALQPGVRVHLYTIGAILGAGGFGITYRAREDITNREVAIKEFLPSAFAVRDRNGSTVRPLSEGAAKDFEWGLERFRQEAKLLIDLRHPNIVPVLAYFEANATGYLVMEFQEGSSLGQILRTRTLSEAETLAIVVPLLDGVEDVHRHRFLHRDIKPENIFVRRDGTPVLLDFGAARQELGEHSKSFTTLLTEGYAPFEQYAGTGNQGPWSDIYALASVMYRCLMGKPPAEAPRRAAAKLRGLPDPMAPEFAALRTHVSSDLAFAIEAGMRVVEHERPQTVAAFRELILAPASASMRAIAAMSAPSPATGTTATATGAPSLTLIPDMAQLATALNPPSWSRSERKKPRRVARYAVIGVVFAAAAAGAAAYIGDQRSWLPEAFKRAGPDAAPPKPVTPAKAEEPKGPAVEPPRQADDAKRRAEEERKRAEDELKRAEEERRDKAMGDHQRRQLEQTEGERRKYFDAQKAAEAERKRQEEQKTKTDADRKAAEERARADEERKRADDERKRAEDAARKRQDDENARGGADRTRRSEERKAAEERRRADDERRRAEEDRRRADDERKRGEDDRRRAEERARRADDERKRAEDAARRRRDDETARDIRRDGFPPPPPSAPGESRDMRRQPPGAANDE